MPKALVVPTAIAALAGFPAALAAQQTLINYVGPTGGAWSAPGNWSPMQVPTSPTHVPVLSGGVLVNLDLDATVDKILMADAACTVSIPSGRMLGIITTADNSGATGLFGRGHYMLSATSTPTRIRLFGDVGTWATFGTTDPTETSLITLSSNFNNFIDASTAGVILLNEGTIQGAGQLGVNTLSIHNSGVIRATSSTVELKLDPPASGMSNTGDLRADGGTLTLTTGNYNNAGGTITLGTGSTSVVHIQNSAVAGGVIRADAGATGQIRATANSSLSGVTLLAPLIVPNSQALLLAGDCEIGAGGSLRPATTGLVRATTNLRLHGQGSLNPVNPSITNIIDSTAPLGVTLTNDLAGGIVGGCNLGNNTLAVINNTTIAAQGGTMIIDPPAVLPFVNNGTLVARTGATLTLQGGTYLNNTAITAEASGTCNLNGTIVGGAITAAPGGVFTAGGFGTLRDLTVSEGTTISVNNAQTAHLQGVITNGGTLSLNATNQPTVLRAVGNATLNGPGMLRGSNSSNNILDAAAPGAALTNNTTIRGPIRVGNDSLHVINNGVIEDGGFTDLLIDPPAAQPFDNNGILRSVRIQNGAVDNTDGIIEGYTRLSGASISGGLIREAASGGSVTAYALSSLANVTLEAPLSVIYAEVLLLTGPIINNDTITINDGISANFDTTLRIAAPEVTLSGTGLITAPATNRNYIDAAVPGQRLINHSTIRGSLHLGRDTLQVVNHGLIEASVSGPGLHIDPPAAFPFQNRATIRSVLNSFLSINDGPIDNTGGLIESAGNISLDNGAAITGGVLRTTGTGAISTTSAATIANLMTEGTFTVTPGAVLTLQGTVNNNASLNVNGFTQTPSILRALGAATLAGSGAVNLSNSPGNWIEATSPGDSLTLEGATIQGAGQIGRDTLAITNRGIIRSSLSAGLLIDPPATGGFINDTGGTLSAHSANLTITDGPFTNAGTIRVETTRVLTRLAGDFNQTAGLTLILGTLQSAGPFNLSGGTLTGTGNLNTHVVNSSGSIDPGHPTSPAGHLTINGPYTQLPAGRLDFQLRGSGSTQFDRLTINGPAALGGALHVRFENSFVPPIGATFRILNATSRTGEFTAVTTEGAPSRAAAVTYDAVGATLVIVQPCGTADFNGDSDIGTDQDIEAFFACLGGHCCDTCFQGGSDFNMDGDAGTDQDIESFFRVLGGGPC
ncbi:MAG TPA: hypothetical protein VD997_08240 [Phycisphaerales bacterium]|nr:hypothetical protein [Phycisphaerales bacterium]